MVGKTSGKSRTGVYLAIIFVLVGLISYSIIKPFLNWKTYTIDDFISFNYPTNWHFQNNGQIMLSGVQNLFLISEYNGELSTQDISSVTQKFLVEGNKISKDVEKSLEDFAKPDLGKCDDGSCIIQISKFKMADSNVLALSVNAIKPSFYQSERYLFIEGMDSLYEIHASFFDAGEEFSNSQRQEIIDKVINSTVIKQK